MFQGSYVALITPFDGAGVDERAFGDFIEWQLSEGTHGLVPCGTTGESPTLSHPEHRRVTEICVEVTKGRAPVVAGTGSNSTEEAISLTRHAKESGADAALVVTPYYNKPTQEGLYQHFKAINDAVDLPLLIYNIPGRSVVDMTVHTMARCAKLANIVGVKDASNSATRPLETRIACGEDFVQLSGEDAAVLALLVEGGHGCISVTGNVAPRICSQMHTSWIDGDAKATLAAQQRLMPLHEALFVESSPAPVKYAASVLGKCSSRVRLPLVEPTRATKDRVESAMRTTGLLN